MEIGYLEGEPCNRTVDGVVCSGVISEHESDRGCSCHVNPPCSYCVDSREYCPTCGWDVEEGMVQTESATHIDVAQGLYHVERQPRILDRSKIDYHKSAHTGSTMKVEGVFPSGTTSTEVAEKVRGTFGGRFESFNPGSRTFVYIAYTD